jgi:16S rRNA (uracil1498-N3)-methyltransferase
LGDNIDMAKRFVLDSKDIEKINDKFIRITGDEIKHLHALRKNVNDEIIINNSKYRINNINKKDIELEYLEDVSIIGVPNIKVSLYQSFVKNDKMDYIIQKSVELGCSSIIPFFSKNSVVKLDTKDRIKRKEKFDKISIEATKQCGRSDIVKVSDILDFKDLDNLLIDHDICILAYENEKGHLKQVINNIKENTKNDIKDIAIIIGPEGGFDKTEVEELKKLNNLYTVSLGQRILRAETASLNLLSIIMYEFD